MRAKKTLSKNAGSAPTASRTFWEETPLPLKKGVKSPRLLSHIPICDQKKAFGPTRKGREKIPSSQFCLIKLLLLATSILSSETRKEVWYQEL
jgi:hypothetical protein